ncbi:TATA-box-binding protein-like 1 [Mercenaria mercenaria]|uniref:TATA-box-binding protein-like 1 n=1 Tax=Mercenaria mercenaria TaxID=6596 RepID=UPI00234F4A0F|nr:TATA-box-binding protein-like 1 [Mercenaria mercenaria]
MIITNVVFSAHLDCAIDLRRLCYRISNALYDPRQFPGLIWQQKTIGGNCLVFSNGVINCNGKATSIQEGRQRLRRYARRIQRLGYTVCLKDIKCLTVSASHTLSTALDLNQLVKERQIVYEPELFSAVNLKYDGVNFCCFHSGKVVITGIKDHAQLDEAVYLVLIELELYTRKKE